MDFDDALLADAEQEQEQLDEPQPSPPAAQQAEPPPQPLKQSTLSFGQQQPAAYLPALNPAQRRAVTAPATGSLQILAGPGSGKTKVLTTRVAYLLQHFKLLPEELVVVTFTNKAANEMKVRLAAIVGASVVDKLMMGTFVCVRYLRKYGKLINLANNFVIADRTDCQAMIKRAIASSGMHEDLRKELKPNTLGDVISKCKSSEMNPEQYRAQQAAVDNPKAAERMEAICRVYEDYQAELARDNALDFDDLLLRGLELLQRFPRVVAGVKNVLIDEFQDTNATQYSLVKLIARACQSLTIVGDPDQSIYGWRNADVENLDKMVKDFQPVDQIYLEENYRSTGAILGAALAVVRQDTKRINKGLKATHSAGSSVVLHCAPTAFDEAAFIAAQIKHIVAHTGGLIDFGDIAILLRYGALSRNIEVALQKAGIPNRMVGGHKFFDRQEVKDILSYLQLADNPSYTAALTRVINVPKRLIGDKTVRDILAAAKLKNMSTFAVCVKLAKGSSFVSLSSAQRKGIKEFVEVVKQLQAMAEEGRSVPDLIDVLCNKVGYMAHLEKTQGPDAGERWMNVEELKAYATVVAEENPDGAPGDDDVGGLGMEEVELPPAAEVAEASDDDEIEIMGDDSGYQEAFAALSSQPVPVVVNSLRVFLAVSMLATDAETQDSKADALERKVTLTTVHAAKGLEWAVIFVPACENGTYPFYRSESSNEIDEERRLLYVAITRAQGFCTLSHSMTRMMGATTSKKDLTPFLATVAKVYPTLFVKKLQKIGKDTRAEMARVLGRAPPDEDAAAALIQAHTDSLPADPPTYEYEPPSSAGGGFSTSQGGSQGRFSGNSYQRYGGTPSLSISNDGQGRWSNNRPVPVPAGAAQGFSSALSTYRAAPVEDPPLPSAPTSKSTKATSKLPADQARLSFGKPFASERSRSQSPPSEVAGVASVDHLPPPPLRRPSQPSGFRQPRPVAASRSTPAAPSTLNGTSTSVRPLPFARPRMVPPSTSANFTSSAAAAAAAAEPRPQLAPQGLAFVPETRQSRINDAVLINPVAGEGVPSDLLERWSSKEQKRLAEIKGLGEGLPKQREGAVEVVDLTTGSDPVVEESEVDNVEGDSSTRRSKRISSGGTTEGKRRKL